MRSVLVVLLLAALALAVWLFATVGGTSTPEDPAIAPPSAPTAPSSAIAPASPGLAVAGRPAPSPVDLRTPVDLAPSVTACLAIVDGSTDRPIAGAAVYRFREAFDEAAIGYSDERGLVPLPLLKPEHLLVVKAGYILRRVPTRPGSTPDQPQSVRLDGDHWSQRVAFEFSLPDGRRPEEVRVLLRPTRDPTSADPPLSASLRRQPAELQASWREQRAIVGARTFAEVHVQLGFANSQKIHVLAAKDEVWFVETGEFALTAATTDGHAASTSFVVRETPTQTVAVALAPGQLLRGTVRDRAGAPIADAQVRAVDGDPLQLVAASDRAGAFALAPLPPGSWRLEARHRDFAATTAGPFTAADRIDLALEPLPKGTIRGRVRSLPGLQPVVGATASYRDEAGGTVAATTGADGTFALARSGNDSVRLNVGAIGFLTHSELIGPDAPSVDVDLWPIDTDTRCRVGLTGLVAGIVVDEGGIGVPGVGVRFTPDEPPPPQFGTRRILAGGAMALPQSVTTMADGTFVLECAAAGPGTVSLLGQEPPRTTRSEVVLGRTTGGLRFTIRRKS